MPLRIRYEPRSSNAPANGPKRPQMVAIWDVRRVRGKRQPERARGANARPRERHTPAPHVAFCLASERSIRGASGDLSSARRGPICA
jgi:hypothetical protein